MSATLADLCVTPPDPGHGEPYLGLTFVCEMAWPGADAALWNHAVWGRDAWAGPAWVDITCWVRGVDMTRGRDPGDRFRVGVAAVELANPDYRFSPWNTDGPYTASGVSFIRPGLVIRFGWVIPTPVVAPPGRWGSATWGRDVWGWPPDRYGWQPAFTGVVESWDEPVEPGPDVSITATVVETLTEPATVNEPAQAVTGAGETTDARLSRLLTGAGWRFPTRLDTSSVTLQGTAMADNRLAECYLSVDSDGGNLYTDTDGAARFEAFGTTLGFAPLATFAGCRSATAYPWTSIVPACDTDRILNVVSVANVGGTAVTQSDPASVSTFGRISEGQGWPRMDLIYQDSAHGTDLANAALGRFAWDDLRVDRVAVDVFTDDRLPALLARLRLRDPILVTFDDWTVPLRVDQIHHAFTPETWVADYGTIKLAPDRRGVAA